jgi:hypothetical protein
MTLGNQLRDLGMKLDMAARELRAIRDPRGPDGNEQLAVAVGALDAAILLIDLVACELP